MYYKRGLVNCTQVSYESAALARFHFTRHRLLMKTRITIINNLRRLKRYRAKVDDSCSTAKNIDVIKTRILSQDEFKDKSNANMAYNAYMRTIMWYNPLVKNCHLNIRTD